jgi:hypothetical protein
MYCIGGQHILAALQELNGEYQRQGTVVEYVARVNVVVVRRETPINVRWLLAGRHNDVQQAGVPLTLAEQVRLWSKMRQAAAIKSATGEPDYKALMWDVLVATGAPGLPLSTDEKKVYSAEYTLSPFFRSPRCWPTGRAGKRSAWRPLRGSPRRWSPPLAMA